MRGAWGLGGGDDGRGGGGGGRWVETYHCYSVAFADKAHLEVRTCISVAVVMREHAYTHA